jgi:hypothetical protein
MGSNPDRDIGFFHIKKLSSYFTVVLLRCPFVPEIRHVRAPEVFLHQ